MTFENALEIVIKEYNSLLSLATTDLSEENFRKKAGIVLNRSLDARTIKWEGNLGNEWCRAVITAPGLLKHYYDTYNHRSSSGRREHGSTTNDGTITLKILHVLDTWGENYVAGKLELGFSPRLNFLPGGSIDRQSGLYHQESLIGKLVIPYSESARGEFFSREGEDPITVTENNPRTGIIAISMKTTLLQKGILNAFLRHMQYDGLDRLFP